MSKINWDKWAVIMSALALIISVVMPFAGYYVLDPKLQELRHAPRLQVTKVYSNYYSKDKRTAEVLLNRTIGVILTNEGRLPASDIKVVFHSDRPVGDLTTKVMTDPPCAHKVDKIGNTIIVSIDRVLGNGQRTAINLTGLIDDIETWVYSNQGAERITASISGLDCTALITAGGPKIDPNSLLALKTTSQISDFAQ